MFTIKMVNPPSNAVSWTPTIVGPKGSYSSDVPIGINEAYEFPLGTGMYYFEAKIYDSQGAVEIREVTNAIIAGRELHHYWYDYEDNTLSEEGMKVGIHSGVFNG